MSNREDRARAAMAQFCEEFTYTSNLIRHADLDELSVDGEPARLVEFEGDVDYDRATLILETQGLRFKITVENDGFSEPECELAAGDSCRNCGTCEFED